MLSKELLGHLTIEMNVIKVAKKVKDKAQDLNYFKSYIQKQKDHNANKYPEKPELNGSFGNSISH